MAAKEEMSVKDIAQRCFLPHQTVAGQLRILKQKYIVTNRKEGRFSFYKIRDNILHRWLNRYKLKSK